MLRWTWTAGFIFLSGMAIYSGQRVLAEGAGGAIPPATVPTEVKVVEQSDDPSPPTLPATQPATQPVASSSPQVNVSDAGTVEIHVNDANIVDVLRMLSLQTQKNILASKDVRGTVTANLYDVTVREALDAILRANGYAYREKGNCIFVHTAKELAEIEKAERKMNSEVFHLYYTPAANALSVIKPVLSSDAQVSSSAPATSGLDTGTKDLGGNGHAVQDILVVTDYADNLERVRKILKEVDRRPQQILIEATILRASLHEDNSLGVDFSLMGGVDFSTLGAAETTPGTALSGDILGQKAGVPLVEKGFIGSGSSFNSDLPKGGLQIGIVTNNIAVFLKALEQVTDTVILANPKVLALNKQKGEVIVGRKDGYLTTTVTQSASVQTVEFLDTGTRLIFRPYIGDDGFIRMEIHPEDSSGGLTSQNLPFKITTEVTSNVMVKDGHTIVIGGLFREDNSSARSQVPFLGNLPLAGALFRSQRDRTTREEIIILLTPHVVKDETAYANASENELKEAEKLRVGVRQGMMPFGRERLAESSYEKAVAEMNKPNPDRQKAIWHLNCATNLNPMFSEAITLKQQLTGQQVSTSDNSTIRGFIRRLVTMEKISAMTDSAPTTQPGGNAAVTEITFDEEN